MKKIENNTIEAAPSRDADMAQLAQIAAWYTPELLMQLSQSPRSRDRAVVTSQYAVTKASGNYYAARGLLASHEQIEKAIDDLRKMISSNVRNKRKDDNFRSLLRAWIAVEPCLSDAERSELQHPVMKILFPKSKGPARISRTGVAQLGGE